MKKLLVTGAHGFIGTAFCAAARKDYGIVPVGRGTKVLPDADIVVHLAARTAKTGHDTTDIQTYRRDNVAGTRSLLRHLTHTPSYILFVSTMDVTVSPLTPYAKSKLEAEKVISGYCTRHAIPFGIARLGSVFGPGEGDYGKVIPVFIRAALEGRSLPVTDPAARRRFVYVEDAARGLLACVHKRRTGIIEITGHREISVGDLARRISGLTRGTLLHPDAFDKKLLREIKWFENRPTIYFDVDGTILNHWKRVYSVYKACCARFGYKARSEKVIRGLRRRGLPDETAPKRSWKMERIESAEVLQTDSLIPGMQEVLRTLHRTHRLVVVSARQQKKRLTEQFERFGIAGYFDDILAVGIIHPVQAKAEVMTKGGTVIGDTEMEIEAARRADMRCISVTWGTRSEAFLRKHGATEIAHAPRAIIRLCPAHGRNHSGSDR